MERKMGMSQGNELPYKLVQTSWDKPLTNTRLLGVAQGWGDKARRHVHAVEHQETWVAGLWVSFFGFFFLPGAGGALPAPWPPAGVRRGEKLKQRFGLFGVVPPLLLLPAPARCVRPTLRGSARIEGMGRAF